MNSVEWVRSKACIPTVGKISFKLILLLHTLVIFESSIAVRPRSLSGLKNFIQANRVTTLEQLLAVLPSDFKKTSVPMEVSRCGYMADRNHPAVVLSGASLEGRQLLLNMTTHPDDPKRNLLKVAAYDPYQAKWDFQTINFNSPKNNPQYPSFSGTNPQSCVGCHGSDPNDLRPNWEQSSYWPGAVGNSWEMTDNDVAQFAIYHGSKNRLNLIYRYLQENPTVSEDYRRSLIRQYLTDQRLTHLNFDGYLRDYKRDRITPAGGLNHRLSAINNIRIVRILRNSDHYAYFKYAIYAALNNCPSIASFIPPESTKIVGGAAALQKYYDEIHNSQAELRRVSAQRSAQKLAYPFTPGGGNQSFAALRFLFESRGIDISNWTNNYVWPRYYKTNFFALSQELVNFDEDLHDFYETYEPWSRREKTRMCNHLKRESHRALRYLQNNPNVPPKTPTRDNHIRTYRIHLRPGRRPVRPRVTFDPQKQLTNSISYQPQTRTIVDQNRPIPKGFQPPRQFPDQNRFVPRRVHPPRHYPDRNRFTPRVHPPRHYPRPHRVWTRQLRWSPYYRRWIWQWVLTPNR